MKEQKDILALLDMMIQPAFCVKEKRIIQVNPAAQQLFLEVGQEILPMLMTGAEEYAEFADGCLSLTLGLAGQPVSACIRKADGIDVFVLEPEEDRGVLQAMALAARELRKPLSGMLTNAAELLDTQEDPGTKQQLAQLNRGLHQMLRLLGNMSDAVYFASGFRMETTEACSFLREVFEKAQSLVEQAGITLEYKDWNEAVYCLLDRQQMERAILNLLSNAVKFTPAGGSITASLTRRGRSLHLTLQDSGSGFAEEVTATLFHRYLRQPGIEDGRYGLGLGMRMIQSVAQQHGGTILVRPAEDGGARIIMTLAIRQKEPNTLHSPVLEIDYTGGFDHSLVELSDCLPASLYDGTF